MDPIKNIEDLIKSKLPDAIVSGHDLVGDLSNLHLGLTVVSDAFIGKRLLQQHRIVMDILKDSLKEDVHAVKIKTITHQEYKELTKE